MENNFSTDQGGGGMVQAVMRVMGRDGERQMKLHLLARWLLTSCCAARFLTGCGLVPGVGDPCFKYFVQSRLQ